MKKSPISKALPQVTRIIKIATCPTCAGKATLTYHFGCSDDQQLYIRIMANSGGGFFSDEWIKFVDIQEALDGAAFPVTSFPLIQLFTGKSVNTPGFLLAVLKHERLVKLLEGKVRGYEKLDSTAFMFEVNKLIASDINLKPELGPIIKKISPSHSSKNPNWHKRQSTHFICFTPSTPLNHSDVEEVRCSKNSSSHKPKPLKGLFASQ